MFPLYRVLGESVKVELEQGESGSVQIERAGRLGIGYDGIAGICQRERRLPNSVSRAVWL
jgi:hypothetical protein